MGPFSFEEDGSLRVKPYSWNQQAHVLYVDLPPGVGFSYGNSTVPSQQEMASRFGSFLAEFYEANEWLVEKRVFVMGDYLSGQLVPLFAKQLFEHPGLTSMKLRYGGVGIGDGWVSPYHQVGYYSSYLYSAGLIDDFRRTDVQKIQTQIQINILNQQERSNDIIDNIDAFWAERLKDLDPFNFKSSHVSRFGDEQGYWAFLNQQKAQFGVPDNVYYQDCNDNAQQQLSALIQNREYDLIFLLAKGKVLLYNTQLDFMVNVPGVLLWLNQLKWNLTDKWKDQTKQILYDAHQPVGWAKAYANLTYVTLYNVGYMVARDAPKTIYNLLSEHFLH